MYSFSQLRKGLAHPVLVGRELNRLYFRRRGDAGYNTKGIDVFEEDWDNLIVLDACRYDLFRDRNTLGGGLESRISRGSSTRDFLRGNFADRMFPDTVYVTANPVPYHYREEIRAEFHDVIHVWKEEGWDEELGTVRPETTTEYARRAAEEYPNKRLIVHYIQPHYPFLDASLEFDKGHLADPDVEDPDPNFWRRRLLGDLDVSTETLWTAYAENLDAVLPHVTDLLSDLTGKTVVTSDHGNVFGERAFPFPIREWGHPSGVYIPDLVTVPWLICDGDGERKEITAGDTTTDLSEVDDGTVAERLNSLGYVE
ncbi:hypothetical protein [Halorientalis pallida]|uniref:Sulfatase n=1 Tax=Halorientalis pallida TaxID=2479928 RepID=A0A498KTR3_9EURY|nr:hypothetical protein [Halorientalis pallida]RXK47444.1 hypothetical protein EAF64_16855 [Halorientalis pallida]